MSTFNIKIAIADDHQMVLEGLQHMIGGYEGIEITATYQTGNGLLAGLKREQPDVLLLDIHFPDFTGEGLVQVILRDYPAIRILAITSVDNSTRVRHLIRMGCLGYLLKNTHAPVLIEAIQTVYRGISYISPDLKEQILLDTLQLKSELPAKTLLLTRREKEILQYICSGYSSKEIANQLFISINTVENHRKHLFQKMDVKNIAGLVRKSMLLGMLD